MSRKKRFIEKLTQEQISSLEEGYKNGHCHPYRERCQCILLSYEGKTVQELAELYDVRTRTIYAWFNRWEAAGIKGLGTKPGRGRKPKLCLDNEQHVKQVRKAIKQEAQKLDRVLSKLEEELNIPMSKRTLQRFLKNLTTDGSASVAA